MRRAPNSSTTGRRHDLRAGLDSVRRRFGVSRLSIAVLVMLSLIAPACTPEQIEMSVENIAISFEQGGVERGLFEAVMVVNSAIPEVGMLLGYALGP